MRTFWLSVVCLAASGCAGFKAVERGEWRLVWADGTQRGAEARREVISREQYEREVNEGNRRGWEGPSGFTFPWLHETEAIGLTVGEVQGYRVDEHTQAELYVDGAGLELFWGPLEKHDSWKGDIDVTVKESTLYLRGQKAGSAKLRLVRGAEQRDVPISIK